MIKEKIVPVLWLMLAALLIGSSIGFAARANASPEEQYANIVGDVICDQITAHPSIRTISVLGDIVVNETGWGYYEAGEVIAYSIVNHCPENYPVMEAFMEVYG